MSTGPGGFAVALVFLLLAVLAGVLIATFPGWLTGKTTARKHMKEGRTLRINSLVETKSRRWALTVVGFLCSAVSLSYATQISTSTALLGILALTGLGLVTANYGAFHIGYASSTERLAHRSPTDT